MKFCNIVHSDVFGNMSILKFPIISVGQLINIFSNIVSKRGEIKYLHFGWFVNLQLYAQLLVAIISFMHKFVIKVVFDKQIVSS